MAIEFFAADSPSAPVFVVQPAMGMKASFYRPLAEALRDAGHHVVLAPLRGHDDGPVPGRHYDFGYAEMVGDLDIALRLTRERLPGSSLYLLGHSLGGHLSLLHAGAHPGAVDGIVLVASSTVDRRVWAAWMLPATHLCLALAAMFGHFPGTRVGFAGREARGVISDWARLSRTGRFEIGRPRVDQTPALARIDVPLLSISVEGDRLAPPGPSEALAALAPNAPLTRVHLDEPLGHHRWVRRPEAVVNAVIGWTSLAHCEG